MTQQKWKDFRDYLIPQIWAESEELLENNKKLKPNIKV